MRPNGALWNFIGTAAAALCFSIYHEAGAADDRGDGGVKKQVAISGAVELESAEMLRARITYSGRNVPVDHAWYSHLLGILNVGATPLPYLDIRSSFEFRQYMNMSSTQYNPKVNNSYNLGDFLYHDFFVREARGIFTLVNNGAVSLKIEGGLMPYKYNPEVRELGEFLFRSGTYPFYLLGDFDRPFARLTGLRAGFSFINDALGADIDVLALTEREIRPFWDVSFAAIAAVRFLKIIDVGAGVDFAHAIPVDDRLTTPETEANEYIIDSTAVTDPATGQPTGGWEYNYGYYSFKGIKLMARFTIDPFGIVRGGESLLNDIIGENGGKIYGETAIIGLENYPANLNVSMVSNPYGYDNLREKTPFMAGITIPLWKVLDVCALEFEYFPSPNPNSAVAVIKDGLPVPFYTFRNPEAGYDTGSGNAYVPRWYWSLYMKKQLLANFSVVGQIGRDHIRWEMPMNYQTSNYDYEEAMVKPDEWGWHIKTIFNF
ncbi:MAG: hypothetical protein JXA18_04840 [Chitinispirillaceae bacterium]|nr:hypothetical protein [Chitinispirillaceae bacterium]